MAGVQYDSYRRGALRRRPESVSALHFLLMFVAAGLLILSRVEHPVSATVEAQGRRIVEPALSAIAEAAQPVRRVVHNAARYLTVERSTARFAAGSRSQNRSFAMHQTPQFPHQHRQANEVHHAHRIA